MSPSSPAEFPIVGVVASAGGLEAFTQLLRRLPPDTGLGFVLIQHLDPTHPSLLGEALAKATAMPVRQVRAERAGPGHGATFSVTFPLAAMPERTDAEARQAQSDGRLPAHGALLFGFTFS